MQLHINSSLELRLQVEIVQFFDRFGKNEYNSSYNEHRCFGIDEYISSFNKHRCFGTHVSTMALLINTDVLAQMSLQ